MTRTQLNRLTRLFLAALISGALLFSIAAARPPVRRLGRYPAEVGQPQLIRALYDVPAAELTVIHPALVSFPPGWKLTDSVCMVILIKRGAAPTAANFGDFQPQAQWDAKPFEAIVFDYDVIVARSPDGSALKIDNPTIGGQVTALTDYQVHWYGDPPILLYENQSLGGLLCYHFYFYINELDVFHLPFTYSMAIQARNVLLNSWPNYFFRYNAPADPADPPQMFDLKREPFETYLTELAAEAPYAVKQITKAQSDQLGTEVPSRKP